MKTYNEMASSALLRINEYNNKKKARQHIIIKTAVPIFTISLISILCIVGFQPVKQQDNSPKTNSQPLDIANTNDSCNVNEATKDSIILNTLDNITIPKMKTELNKEDFVKMSQYDLNKYFTTKIFPTVPNDLTIQSENTSDNSFGIYRKNKGTGEVYLDQIVLNYIDSNNKRYVNIEIGKNTLPELDFSFVSSQIYASMIKNEQVLLGCDNAGYYQAKFIHNSTGFVVTTNGLNKDEFISIIKSLL